MSKRIIITFLVCIATVVVMQAENVTRKEANSLAQTFFNAAYSEITLTPQMVWNGRQLTTDRLFEPIYVYNSPRGGYVIISGENKAFPILGYSLQRNFDRNKLSDDERKILEKYAREIEIIRYDPRMPVSALEAWQNLNAYIVKMLKEPYNTPEYKLLSDEKRENLEALDRAGRQILLPQATEFNLYDPDRFRDVTLDDITADYADSEYIPFSFYEYFVKEMIRENREKEIDFEEMIAPSKPVVKALGGGHFEIRFPENVRMMRVYALDGMQMMEKYFKETDVVNIDLTALSSGYYVSLILSDSGKIYGLKLYR